ncbi:MAG: BsuBI/PstI family type II restriction endonuclease [Planctomycetota bacterium]|nr:BsuBI/PstI family type II restriction endonuclease [Planctomycetota bacterium]
MTKKRADIVGYDASRSWFVLIAAVTSAGPVDGKRREEWKELFVGSAAGLVFVTAFTSRDTTRSFLPHSSWETEVWIAAGPDHLIQFNGERFSGPFPDVMLCRLMPQ